VSLYLAHVGDKVGISYRTIEKFISLDSKYVRPHLKLPQGNPRGMHPMLECIGRVNDQAIPQL
jgi:hypothetical protein